jgi:predicted transcriptional regulator
MRSLPIEVTAGPRADILACVRRVPGIHLRSVERQTGLPLGQVLYHLDRLERMGLVVSLRDAGFRRYFVASEVPRGEKRVLMALRHTVPRHVLVALLERGPLAHKDLQSIVGTAGSTLTFHLQRLREAGVLERAREDAATRYHVAQPEVAKRILIYHRESFQDAEVDRFARAELARLLGAGGGEVASRSVPIGF